jgi:hypothetical protein
LLVLGALPVLASDFVVDSTADAPDMVPGDGWCQTESGECTIRAAVMEAEALPGLDRIEVPSGVYTLTLAASDPLEEDPSMGDLDLTDHLEIVGAGAESTIIDASLANDRVIALKGLRYDPDPPQLVLTGLTLTGGRTTMNGGCVDITGRAALFGNDMVFTDCASGGSGGGISFRGYLPNTRIELTDSFVTDNTGNIGGGIYINGHLVLTRTVIARNEVIAPDYPRSIQSGGGIYLASGTLTAVDSAISDNVAGRRGGGLTVSQSKVVLDRCAVSGNRALDIPQNADTWAGTGGGIWMDRGDLTVVNSTISGNSAEHKGGGAFIWRPHVVEFAHSTISQNNNSSSLAGAGIRCESCSGGGARFRGTIISGNAADGISSDCDNFGSSLLSLGFNLDSDGSCAFTDPTDLPSVDPMLAPLADNGGVGPTHGLMPGSPALDHIPADQCFSLINNDWDRETDEDPVDGIDNDGDLRIDEDPVEYAVIDQRGADRPAGAGCDIGAFEGEATAETVIESLIVDVEELIEAGEINYGRGRSLIAELQVALWFLEFKNGERIAIMRIELFIIKVERLMDKGDLDPDLGNELLAKANAILEMLQ